MRLQYVRHRENGSSVALFSTVYNVVVLLTAAVARIERPIYDRPQRQIPEPITCLTEVRSTAGNLC